MKDDTKVQAKKLCDQIREIYPEIGECGVNVDVWYEVAKQSWVVHFFHGEHQLKTYIEPEEVTACIEGRQCLHLGVQVEQLIENVKAA